MPYGTTKRIKTKYATLPATANNDRLLQYRSLLQTDEIGDIGNPVRGKCCFLTGVLHPEMLLLLGSFVPFYKLTNSGVSLITRSANGALG